VLSDFKKAEDEGLAAIQEEMGKKMAALQELLEKYNDGRRKSFFCNAVNLLSSEEVRKVMEAICSTPPDPAEDMTSRARRAAEAFEAMAAEKGIDLKLRK
jgi:hypothetical protein